MKPTARPVHSPQPFTSSRKAPPLPAAAPREAAAGPALAAGASAAVRCEPPSAVNAGPRHVPLAAAAALAADGAADAAVRQGSRVLLPGADDPVHGHGPSVRVRAPGRVVRMRAALGPRALPLAGRRARRPLGGPRPSQAQEALAAEAELQ